MQARSIVALAFALVAVCSPMVSGQSYEGRELVKAELLADTTAVIPGRPFTVGLLLRMAPGWHTYWKFPGDAGIPTEIKWQLPEGWKSGEIQWPIPLKLDEPGDIRIYGYHDNVLLMTELIPPAGQPIGPVTISAAANWLVCEKICIPGDASLQLTLPVQREASAANAEIFSQFRSALPRDWAAVKGANHKWSRAGSTLRLEANSPELANWSSFDFFPLPEGTTVVGHPRTVIERDKAIATVPLESQSSSLQSIKGVLVATRGSAPPERAAWFVNDVAASASSTPVAPPPSAAASAAKFLLFGFIGGLILNLMPCVLPVISLKIFGFVQQAGQSRSRILRSGLAFVAGIFTWFLGLAVLMIALRNAGHQITWAIQFTNPYFVVGMSALVLVFALNLFGVYEIMLPAAANSRVLAWSAREGEAGAFFQGVFATVLATPCTAPFLGSALGFAFTQPSFMIVLMFVAIAAGMGAPYVVLSAQPAWLRMLPKPGLWMERVKQFMGFLLLATLLFLLWVLGAERGSEAIVWTGCFLLALSIACWIKGNFIRPETSAAARIFAVAIMLLLTVMSGAYFIGGKFRQTSHADATQPLSGWQAFSPAALDRELAQGRAVFIDFTAAWCLTCKFNEATVLEASAVREAFQRHDIVKFKADWTNADPEITKMLKQFGRPGVPLYVLYPGGKSDQPIVLPELLTQGLLIDKIETTAQNVALK